MIIQNGLVHDGVNPTPYEADIAIRDGVIAAIGPHLDPQPGEEVISAAGKRVYPGFVDAHTHLGLDGYGVSGLAGHDYNEMGDIVCPQLRGIDGFNPQDKSVAMALAGGVMKFGGGSKPAHIWLPAVDHTGDVIFEIDAMPYYEPSNTKDEATNGNMQENCAAENGKHADRAKYLS